MAGSGKPKLVGLIGATGGVGRLCAAALQEQVSVRCMCARAIESSRVIVPPDASSRIIMMIITGLIGACDRERHEPRERPAAKFGPICRGTYPKSLNYTDFLKVKWRRGTDFWEKKGRYVQA